MLYNILPQNRFTFSRRLFLVLTVVCALIALSAIEYELTAKMIIAVVFTLLFLVLFIWTTALSMVARDYHRIIRYHATGVVTKVQRDLLIKTWYAQNEKMIKSSGVKSV